MNPVLADEYGIVMGTSHHEPMMRAQKSGVHIERSMEMVNGITELMKRIKTVLGGRT